MDIDQFLQELEVFRDELKQKDEKLYYKFLNLYDGYISHVGKEIKQMKKQDKKSENVLSKLAIDNEKRSRELHDLKIKYEVELNKLKKELTSDEHVDKLYDKLIDHANAIGLSVMGRPRFCGFMLFFFGYSGIERLAKYVDENRDKLKDNKPNKDELEGAN